MVHSLRRNIRCDVNTATCTTHISMDSNVVFMNMFVANQGDVAAVFNQGENNTARMSREQAQRRFELIGMLLHGKVTSILQ